MKLSLNAQILTGAVSGVVLGFVLAALGPQNQTAVSLLYFCGILGSVFINLLKMILIPLVFTSITVGIANLRAHAQIHLVWRYTLVYFVGTLALAVLLGMLVVNLFKPGVGVEVEMFQNEMSTFSAASMSLPQFLEHFVGSLFLNPFQAMANGDVLPTIIFALFLGIILVKEGEKAQTILNLLSEFFEIIMKLVNWIMKIAPLGIFGLLAKLVATQNLQILGALGKFIAVVLGATLIHGLVTLPVVLLVFTRVSPQRFFSGVKEALVTAFSTSSSSATLPVTMQCVESNLRIRKDIAGFVLPLGATINMDGTALYEAVAAIFIANLVGVDLNAVQQLVIFFTAMIAAIGAPGIPSAGMVTMVMVLQSVGLPAEAIAILLPIDRLLDAVRTTVNVEGDAIGCCVVTSFLEKNAESSTISCP